MTVRLPSSISFSQLTSYSECGERFRLERILRVPSTTWWATILGSAVHEVTEWWDRERETKCEPTLEDTLAKFFEIFDRLDEEEDRPKQASGRVLQKIGYTGGPSKKDREWCLTYGPLFVEQYIVWRKQSGWRIATLGGELAIELPVSVDIAHPETGEILPVRGVIDRVFLPPMRKGMVVTDIKTGKLPESRLQLVTYGAALGVLHPDLRFESGAFWQPGATEPKIEILQLRDWGQDYLWGLYLTARKGIEHGIYLPNVTSMCRGCPVKDYCWAVSGDKAIETTSLALQG